MEQFNKKIVLNRNKAYRWQTHQRKKPIQTCPSTLQMRGPTRHNDYDSNPISSMSSSSISYQPNDSSTPGTPERVKNKKSKFGGRGTGNTRTKRQNTNKGGFSDFFLFLNLNRLYLLYLPLVMELLHNCTMEAIVRVQVPLVKHRI